MSSRTDQIDEGAEAAQAWAAEIRRRVEELRSGAVQPVPGEQVFEDLKSLDR